MGLLSQICPLIRTPPRSVRKQLVGLGRLNPRSRTGKGREPSATIAFGFDSTATAASISPAVAIAGAVAATTVGAAAGAPLPGSLEGSGP
jgi:hypothetical protein